MEPVSLGVIVAALLAKVLDRAEDGIVGEGAGVLRRLVDVVRQRFSDAGDEEASLALERVADAPDSAKRVEALAALLGERAGGDETFRNELEGLVEQARAAGIDVGSISQVTYGDENVQVAGVTNSSISVTGALSPDTDRAPRSAG